MSNPRAKTSEVTPLSSSQPQGNETSAPRGEVPSYDALGGQQRLSTKNSIAWSVASERRYSTARLFGIMIPKDFWHISRCAIFSMSMSVGAVFANRLLFAHIKFPPMLAQLMQMTGTAVLSALMGAIASCTCRQEDGTQLWPTFSYQPSLAVRLLPLTLCFIPRILFTNLALGATQVSTYQVTRQSAIIFSVLFSYILLHDRPGKLVLFSCGIIVTSVFVVSLDPTSLSFDGFIKGVGAAVASALYLVIVKYFMPLVKGDHRSLVNYNSVTSVPFLLLFAWLSNDFEKARNFFPWIREEGVAAPCSQLELWTVLITSIVTSLLINVASMLLVKATSPVTYDVIGTFKGIVQTIGGILFMGDTTTVQNIVGIVLSTIGSALYGKAKHLEHVTKVKRDAAEKKRLSKENRLREDNAMKAQQLMNPAAFETSVDVPVAPPPTAEKRQTRDV